MVIIWMQFRPHGNTMYVDAAYCYRLSSMVCQSVTVIDAVWAEDLGGPKEPCTIRWGSRCPLGRGNFGERGGPL